MVVHMYKLSGGGRIQVLGWPQAKVRPYLKK
jgi:hypothetical protein